MLISSLISDFATLLPLRPVIGIISRGFGVEILLFLVLLAVFLAATQLGQWAKGIPGLLRMIDELSHATAQLRVRGVFALLVILVALAQALGVELVIWRLSGRQQPRACLAAMTRRRCARSSMRSVAASQGPISSPVA